MVINNFFNTIFFQDPMRIDLSFIDLLLFGVVLFSVVFGVLSIGSFYFLSANTAKEVFKKAGKLLQE